MHSTPRYRLVRLANGSQSIHSIDHDETFHPVIGPVQEAEALYVRQLNLPARLEEAEGDLVIWDVGLGAAANAIAVLEATRRLPGRIRLVSFDLTMEPLRFALQHAAELGYLIGYESWLERLLAKPGRSLECLRNTQSVEWRVQLGDFPTVLHSPLARELPKPHAILFDAFSPATNPGMWTQPLFNQLFRLLDPARPCAMPTYSRSTMLRVTLLLAGFFVGKGQATGEKEETTLAANVINLLRQPLDRGWLARARNSTCAEPLREPAYRRAPLSASTWEKLRLHPQFEGNEIRET